MIIYVFPGLGNAMLLHISCVTFSTLLLLFGLPETGGLSFSQIDALFPIKKKERKQGEDDKESKVTVDGAEF